MHASKDLMWRRMWKILQNFLGSKQGLNKALLSWLNKVVIAVRSSGRGRDTQDDRTQHFMVLMSTFEERANRSHYSLSVPERWRQYAVHDDVLMYYSGQGSQDTLSTIFRKKIRWALWAVNHRKLNPAQILVTVSWILYWRRTKLISEGSNQCQIT